MINLLPPQQKKELRERRTQKAIIIWGFLLSFFFIALILGLLAIKFQLSGENIFQKTTNDLAKKDLEAKQNQTIKKEILDLNRDISFISAFYQNRPELTEVLKKLIVILPPGISLNSLSFQKEDGSLHLTGLAQTRNDLIAFKENLEKEKIFSAVSFPPSNWIKAKEINFFIGLTLSTIN